MVLAWENLWEVFVMLVVVVVFTSPEVFHSLLFDIIPHSSVSHRRVLHSFYTFSPAHHREICDTFILTFLGFSVTVLPQALRFCVGVFYLQAFFTLRSFTNICGTFFDSDEGRNTPSRILLCAYPHKVVPSG